MPELTPSTINPAFLKTHYAIRGELDIKAERYRNELKAGGDAAKKLPFEKVITANVGNPQQRGLDQKPLTFGRQVSSIPFLRFADAYQGAWDRSRHCWNIRPYWNRMLQSWVFLRM